MFLSSFSNSQYFLLSKEGEIRRDEACLDYAGKDVVLYPCHGSKGNQLWIYDDDVSLAAFWCDLLRKPLTFFLSRSIPAKASKARQQRQMSGTEQPKAGDGHLRHRKSGPALEVLELRPVEICEFGVALRALRNQSFRETKKEIE